jgi:Sortase domain
VTRHAVGGRGVLAALALGLALIAAGTVGLVLTRGGPVAGPSLARVPAPGGPAASVPWPVAAGQAAAGQAAAPVRLTIPAIGVRTRLVRLGLTRAGTLQVPASYQVAGWYDRSPPPGATGSAIIAGHIDSYRGPGVFFRLAGLHQGDRAYVRRADGSLVVFRVTAVRLYRKDRFPTATVYGPAAGPQLRLITCGGTFNPALRSYQSDVVVYAVAAGKVAQP